jgi:hypothetical protein
LYTRRVIGEETLSSTRAFSLRRSSAWFANTRSLIFSPFDASDSARYWAISEATWTLALSGKDIKQKAQLLLAFQRLRKTRAVLSTSICRLECPRNMSQNGNSFTLRFTFWRGAAA